MTRVINRVNRLNQVNEDEQRVRIHTPVVIHLSMAGANTGVLYATLMRELCHLKKTGWITAKSTKENEAKNYSDRFYLGINLFPCRRFPA